MILNKLPLTFKQSLKFLNTLRLGLKDEIVFLAGQCLEITKPVITGHTIKVVDNPTLRKLFAIVGFPYDYMLHHVSVFLRSMVSGDSQLNISVSVIALPPVPFGMVLSSLQFSGTLSATLRYCATQFTTIKAWMLGVLKVFAFIHTYTIPYNHLNNKLGCENGM